MFLKPLFSVFGEKGVFASPDGGSFPLLQLPGRKVVFLDEWRFSDDIMSWASQCLWYDGSVVPVRRPQNIPGMTGHIEYRGTAPIFVTSKLKDLKNLSWWAANDPWTGAPRDAEASMIFRRLKIYECKIRMDKPPANIPLCGQCFARLVFDNAEASCTRG